MGPDAGSCRFSSLAVPQQIATQIRNIQTSFLKLERSSDATDKANEKIQEGEQTIVMHPGSMNLRLGLAKDALPRTVPHVIARRRQPHEAHEPPQDSEADEADAANQLKLLQEAFAKSSRRKLVSSYAQQAASFNAQSTPQTIGAINDAFCTEWTDVSLNPKFVVGDRIDPLAGYELRFPLKNGHFNGDDYLTADQVTEDLHAIWRQSIEAELGVSPKRLKDFSCILVVADGATAAELKEYSKLLCLMNFKKFFLLQESVAASFGAGLSSAVVVDLGHTKTSVAVVEDGILLGASLCSWPVGGLDVTRVFWQLTQLKGFPYKACRFDDPNDFLLLNDLKEKICSLHEDDLAPKIFEFFSRQPNSETKLFSAKFYDERIVSPFVLFHFPARKPEMKIPQFSDRDWAVEQPKSEEDKKREVARQTKEESEDELGNSQMSVGMAGSAATPVELGLKKPKKKAKLATESSPSKTAAKEAPGASMEPQSADSIKGLCSAILYSVSKAPREKQQRLLGNILLNGGSSLIHGLTAFAEERLGDMARPMGFDKIETILYPRDVDPRYLSWKGAAVFCRLEGAAEAFISAGDFQDWRSKILYEKLVFYEK